MSGIPSAYQTTLKQALASGGSEAEIFVSSITTLDGQTISTSDFAQLGAKAYLVIDPLSSTNYEICSFTAVDGSGVGFTGITRGLSLKGDGSVISANKKFHAVGTTVILTWGAPELQAFMDLSSGQTVNGVKTFGNFPVGPSNNPTTGTQLATKNYVDGVLVGTVANASNQTAGTVKTDQNPNSLARVMNVLVQQPSTPTMSLKVLPFNLAIDERNMTFGGGNTPTMTAPVSNPRIDLIVTQTSGAIFVRTGAENAVPVVPTPSSGDIVLAEVFHQTTETVIKENTDGTNGYIQRWRYPAQYRTDIVSGFTATPTTGSIPVYSSGNKWSLIQNPTSGLVLTAQGAALPIWQQSTPNLYAIATPTTTAAVTTEQTLYSYTLPAGTIGTTGGFIARIWFPSGIWTSNTNGTFRFYFGSQSNGFTFNAAAANGLGNQGWFEFQVMNAGSTSSQQYGMKGFWGVSGVGSTTTQFSFQLSNSASIDTTVDQIIKATFQFANSSNNVTANMMTVSVV